MARTLVTVGSDGFVDWVQTPDGLKHTLGPVSVAQFVARLSNQPARAILDRFLRSGAAVFPVDLEQMWDLLKPRRVRMAVSPFMPSSDREARILEMDEKFFTEIEANITEAEKILGKLHQASSETRRSELRGFVQAAQKIKSPNQSKNETYYGLGAPDVYEATDAPPKVEEAPTAKAAGQKLAYDTYQANTKTAETILTSLEETDGRIDSLVKEGKKFNAARAKSDLYEVSTKVAGILRDVDLTQPWVREDLAKLADSAKHLHGLFFPKSA